MVYIPQSTIPRPRNGSFAYGNVDSKDRRMKKLLRANCTTVVVGWGAWHVQRFPLSPAAYGSALHEAVLGLRRALGAQSGAPPAAPDARAGYHNQLQLS